MEGGGEFFNNKSSVIPPKQIPSRTAGDGVSREAVATLEDAALGSKDFKQLLLLGPTKSDPPKPIHFVA